jgi:hypothetical protein
MVEKKSNVAVFGSEWQRSSLNNLSTSYSFIKLQVRRNAG